MVHLSLATQLNLHRQEGRRFSAQPALRHRLQRLHDLQVYLMSRLTGLYPSKHTFVMLFLQLQ